MLTDQGGQQAEEEHSVIACSVNVEIFSVLYLYISVLCNCSQWYAEGQVDRAMDPNIHWISIWR